MIIKIIEDISFIAIGFAGAFTLIKYRPSVAGLIQNKISTAEDKAGEAYSKAEDTAKTIVK